MSNKLAEEQPVRKNSWDRLQGIWKHLNGEVDTWKGGLTVFKDDSFGDLTMLYVEYFFDDIEDDLDLLHKELHPQERRDLENHIYAALDATRESRAALRRVVSAIEEFQSIGGRHWHKPIDAASRYKRLE